MIGDFEKRIRHQLSRAHLVRAQPFAPDKKRRLDILAPQVIDDAAIVAGNFAILFAKVER